MHLSRPIPEGFEVKQIRVVKRASGYWAMLTLQCDVEVPQVSASGHGLGIDLGLEHFLATSDGELIDRPRFFVGGQRKLKSLQRQLKRKKKGREEISSASPSNCQTPRVHLEFSERLSL